MTLPYVDQEIFWDLWLKVLAFVNDEYNLLPGFGHPRFPQEVIEPYDDIRILRDKLWSDDAIIERFVKAHPGLGRLKTNILRGWTTRVEGTLVIVRFFDDYTVFLDDENKCLWGVLGVSSEIKNIISYPLPYMVSGVLLPFKNRITYDTLLSGSRSRIVGNMWQGIEDQYQAYKKNGLRIGFGDKSGEYLLAEVPEDIRAPQKPMPGGNSSSVMERMKAKVQEIVSANPEATLEEINKKLSLMAKACNNEGLEHFDGLSPNQISRMMYKPFGENGVAIKTGAGNNTPLAKQALYLLGVIARSGRVKLTEAGNLPIAIVEEITAQNFVHRRYVETFFPKKRTREDDVWSLKLTHILCETSGLIKKRGGALELTQKGKEHLAAGEVFAAIFQAYCEDFNWAYFDFAGEEFDDVGVLCYPFSFYLLAKYGSETRGTDFYIDKYQKAFFEGFTEEYDIRTIQHMYTWRTFDNFLDNFGFLDPAGRTPLGMKTILLTPLFSECLDIDVAMPVE